MIAHPDNTYKQCIVGNFIGDQCYGAVRQIKSGTKHFRPGTKVYCIFKYGGMGIQQVKGLGKLRKDYRIMDEVMNTCNKTNFRMKKFLYSGE